MTGYSSRVTTPEAMRQAGMPTSLADKMMFIAVCAVPFQQALTIPLGFPLKISEIFGIAAVLLYIVEGRRPERKYAGAFFQWSLLALTTLSTLVWLVAGPPEEVALGYDRGLTADMLLYFAYALIVILISWFAGTRLGPDWIGRGIGWAVRFAAIYSVIQGALYLTGTSSALSAIRGTQQIGTAFGIDLTRNGPFLEGNYLGFFAGVALFTALRWRDRGALIAAVFCLLYSQSTVAVVGVIVGLLVVVVLRPSGRVGAVVGLMALVGIVAIAFIDTVGVYVTRQLGKLGFISSPELGASIEYSLRNRTATVQRGIDMSENFPLFGVGPGRFGYWDDFYTTTTSVSTATGGRGIANNAYVQILAEEGVLAAACFIILLAILLLRNVRGARSNLALAAFLIVGLTASPSWTVLPIWFTIAYLATTRVQSNDLGVMSSHVVSATRTEKLRGEDIRL